MSSLRLADTDTAQPKAEDDEGGECQTGGCMMYGLPMFTRRYCTSCGGQLARIASQACSTCGQKASKSWRYCANCGAAR